MNFCKDTASIGFALLELVVVMAVVGVLASIATPNYLSYKIETKTTACQANRRNIEAAESAYFIQNNAPGLTIPASYACPSDGTYVWLVSNPEDSRYPRIGCSVHYGDLAPEPETPDQAIDKLKDYVIDLGLPANVEKKLIDRLDKAKVRYEKDKIARADRTLDFFKNQIRKNRKKIPDEDEAFLYSKADEIQEILRKLP